MGAVPVDYTDAFRESARCSDIICAQGLGRNCPILERLPETYRRLDGKNARYLLQYRWLSRDCEHWKEVRPVLEAIEKGVTNLFGFFRLFP